MAVTINNSATGRGTVVGDGVGILDAMTSTNSGGERTIRAEDDTPLIVISANAPNNADGRPDGTVFIRTVAP